MRDDSSTPAGDIAPWHSPAIICTVIVAATVIAGAILYVLLGNAGGLAAVSAAPALLAVLVPGAAGLAYALFLSRRLRHEHLFAAAFEAIPAPRAILSLRLKTLATNAAFRRVFGEEVTAPLDLLEQRMGDDPEAARGLVALREAAAAGKRAVAQITLVGGEGSRRWYRLELGPADAGARRLLLRVDDQTAARETEQAVRRRHHALSTFLDRLPVAVWSADASGGFRYVNATFARWLGQPVAEIVGGERRLHDVIDGPLPAGTPFYDPFGTGAMAGVLAIIGEKGQRIRALASQSLETRDKSGIYTRGIAIDLTAVPLALAEESRSGEGDGDEAPALSFQKIFRDAPVGIALLDLDGKVLESNPAFAGLTLGQRKSPAGWRLESLFVEDEREALARQVADTAATGEPGPLVESHPAASPDTVCSLHINRMLDPEGRPYGLMVHALDITEQSRLEMQFAQSQKMQAVGQLAGGVAHDFNNLLTAMIGFCDLLLLRHRPGEESFADIMQIKQNANRAANLVRQLLAFSRQQTLEPRVLDLTDILAELTHLLRRLIGESIEMKMIHGRDLGLVRVDQGQFEQVVINLAVNARDAMPEGGLLTIHTSNVSSDDPRRTGHDLMPAGDYVMIEVVDTGVGISRENQGRIFEPFYTSKEVGAGTGLGLSTVYGIVKQTGGFIFVDSKPGKGARFSVFLPRHEETAEEKSDARPSAEDDSRRDLTGAGTVLLVEDEDAVRLFGARALRNKGYKVMEATSGEEALQYLNSTGAHIDLLITDVVMPNMDGPTLIREIRETRPDLRVICISGYAEDAFRRRLDRSRDVHFLPKPFSLQQLAGKVKDVLQADAGGGA